MHLTIEHKLESLNKKLRLKAIPEFKIVDLKHDEAAHDRRAALFNML